MAESRRDSTHAKNGREKATQHGAKEAETATEHAVTETERAAERGIEALRRHTERVEEIGREGARRTSKASAATFAGAARTGSTLADTTQEIVGAWARYAEDVMRNTSQASQALLRSRSIPEIMQAQLAFVHDNLRSFLDHSAKLADTASRIATRPFAGLKEVSAEQVPR
jgi:hypothetical protein